MLGLPQHILKIHSVTVRPENSKRLKFLRAYLQDAAECRQLRKVALCLRVSLVAVSITARKKTGESDLPPFACLGRGDVQRRACEEVEQILGHIDRDPLLDVADALIRLLTTLGHILIRFAAYSRYPYKVWEMCAAFNPLGYLNAITEFLQADPTTMDAGYTMPLWNESWASGTEAAAMDYLTSDTIQQELQRICKHVPGNSLDVERKNKQDKQAETTKMTTLARCSRNSILQRYGLLRAAHVLFKIAREKAAGRKKYMNLRAVAIQETRSLFARARGKLKHEDDVSPESAAAIVHQGDEKELKAYVAFHRQRLAAVAKAIRAAALSGEIEPTMLYSNVGSVSMGASWSVFQRRDFIESGGG